MRYVRGQCTVEGWSGASFGQDDGGRSHTGILLVIAGGAVSWQSSRQTPTDVDCTSEIIAAVDNMVLARALAPLWAEMCRQDLRWSHPVTHRGRDTSDSERDIFMKP